MFVGAGIGGGRLVYPLIGNWIVAACIRRPIVSRGKNAGISLKDLVSTFCWEGW